MPITPEGYRRRFPDRPEPIPLEYAGKWIAWDRSRRTIVASADNLHDLRRLVSERGINAPIVQSVPRGAFIGGPRRPSI